MTHPDWTTTHHGTTTTQSFTGEGEPTVLEKCKSAPLQCPFCAEALDPASDGWEHPASDSCPLDSLFILHRHVEGWNRRAHAPDHSGDATKMAACRKCGAAMSSGIALAQTYTGSPDDLGGDIVTMSPGGPGDVVPCRKCPQCGWSVTGAAPQEAEPVAWRRMNHEGTQSTGVTDTEYHANLWRKEGHDVQPLYAHPAPAPAVPVEGAPERIWAWAGDEQDGWENAYATISHVSIEQVAYIRADLAHTAPVDAGTLADLIERLEHGVCPSGMHEDNSTELYMVDDANDTMAEAAAALRAYASSAPAAQVEDLDAIREEFRTDSGFYDLSAMLRTIAALRTQPAPQVKSVPWKVWDKLCHLFAETLAHVDEGIIHDESREAFFALKNEALSALSGEAQR